MDLDEVGVAVFEIARPRDSNGDADGMGRVVRGRKRRASWGRKREQKFGGPLQSLCPSGIDRFAAN